MLHNSTTAPPRPEAHGADGPLGRPEAGKKAYRTPGAAGVRVPLAWFAPVLLPSPLRACRRHRELARGPWPVSQAYATVGEPTCCQSQMNQA
jgi:hypothetical protein